MNRKLLLPYILVLSAVYTLIACTVVSPTPESIPTPTPTVSAPLPSSTPLPILTATPIFTPLPLITATPTPHPTLTPAPTQAATIITPIVKGSSVGAFVWSPDSRWLPLVHFNPEKLQFYDALKSALCDFPAPIHYSTPYRFLAWLADGRVVVQAADKVLAGRPCETFAPASAAEILALDRSDPSFSPGGKYQVVFKEVVSSSFVRNATIELKEVATGKVLSKTTFTDLPRGGGPLPGLWLDANHFLIVATDDQGPLLISPDRPLIQIAAEIFHLPLRPGNEKFDLWEAMPAVTSPPSQFHLMLVGLTGNAPQQVKNPLQVYHSESGQFETLPYLASQATFSNDGHWLMVNQNPDRSSKQNWIRPIDPPGAPFEPLSEKIRNSSHWSPDGTKVIVEAPLAGENLVFSIYSSPQGVFLSAWQATGYELSPSWSPDGKTLSVWGRLHNDPGQQAIFVVRLPDK